MKVKFYYTNGYCGCQEEEIADFPNALSLDDPEIIDYGDEGWYFYMESWADDRFVDYPDEETFDSEEDYETACDEVYEKYMENGDWWCEEYEEEDE